MFNFSHLKRMPRRCQAACGEPLQASCGTIDRVTDRLAFGRHLLEQIETIDGFLAHLDVDHAQAEPAAPACRWRIALGVCVGGCLQRHGLRLEPCDLVRDATLERLDREVGQGDLVVAMLPGSSYSRANSPLSRSSAPKPRPGPNPTATP